MITLQSLGTPLSENDGDVVDCGILEHHLKLALNVPAENAESVVARNAALSAQLVNSVYHYSLPL